MCRFIESIRIEDGRICRLRQHTERCNRTRAAFWKEEPPVDLKQVVAVPSEKGIFKCRIVYGREIEEVTYTPYQMRQVNTLRLVVDDAVDYTYKSTDREGLNRLRIVYGREIEEVTYTPYQMRQVNTLRLVVDDAVDYTYKSTDREGLNRLYARRDGADDVLIVKDGRLTDTSIGNVAFFDGQKWYTPLHPLLKGTMRGLFD